MPPNDVKYDASSALICGARDYQEDAVIVDFPVGAPSGVIVLADGMGGHAAGDIASKIVMTEVFCELKFQSSDQMMASGVRNTLLAAADGANQCIAAHIAENPEAEGMGATLIGAVVHGDRLDWVSVGDSPLYLFRDNVLTQLNEDHSMAPQIDQMIATGQIDEETGKNHPDRNALLSVLSGDEIARIDCPKDGIALQNGDILIAASDGLQFLEHDVIEEIVRALKTKPASEIARALLDELGRLDDPDQDNTSMAIIKVDLNTAQDEMTAALQAAFDTFESSEPSERMFEPPERVRARNRVSDSSEEGDDAAPDAINEPAPVLRLGQNRSNEEKLAADGRG